MDDERHIRRYFDTLDPAGKQIIVRIKVPRETTEALARHSGPIMTADFSCITTYHGDDIPVPYFSFSKIRQMHLPGSVFGLSGIDEVVFWRHRTHSGARVFLVEFSFESEAMFTALERHFIHKYGKEREATLEGRRFYLTKSKYWTTHKTIVRLLEVEEFAQEPVFHWKSTRYGLVFVDADREREAIKYIDGTFRAAASRALQGTESSSAGQ